MRWLLAIALLSSIASMPALASCNVVNGKPYGDCTNVKVNTEPSPALTARGYQEVDAIYEGAEVPAGAVLVVRGMVNGVTRVHSGGRLIVHGTVNRVICDDGAVEIAGTAGNVVMNGGTLNVAGIVDHVSGAGAYSYESGAVVNGVPYEMGAQGMLPR